MSTPPSTRSAVFAALLREFRRARGLTQEELAARAGISSRSLGYLERDDVAHAPRRDTLRLLIQALGLSDEEAARLSAAVPRTASGSTAEPTPPRSATLAARASLPVPLTPLIGREHEEAAAVHLLTRETTRLLTLTGPAGVGKTRLGLQVAATLRDAHGWTVGFVGLIPVHEPERVVPVIAQTLGVQESAVLSPYDALVVALRDHAVLLALDNFEQVLAAAPTLAALLGVCPKLKLLVTSRAPLNVRGEQVFAVPPLALADADTQAPPPAAEQLERVASVVLFVERARAAAPDFALDPAKHDAQMAQVAAICRQVDGLPLAIELAAAQVRHFALEELAARLGGAEALGILAGGPRDLAGHQRTMRTTIAWSYALLAQEEQRLCRVLSVFAGGAMLDAIQTVAQVDADAALSCLSALVDNGLARRTDHPLGSRYDQLVIVRAYAREQLCAAGEEDETRRRHADYCLELVRLADLSSGDESGTESGRLFERADTEYENVRAALVWARDTGTITHGLRMAGNLRRFWSTQFREGLKWMEYFIGQAPQPTTPEEMGALAEAWTGVMVIAHRQDRFERARDAGEIALALRRAQGDKKGIAAGMSNLANPLISLHQFDRARALFEECLALHREANDRRGMIFPLLNLGSLYYELGNMPEALALNEESIAISRELGENDWARTLTWVNIGEIYVVLDEPARGRAIIDPIYQLYLERGDNFGIGMAGLVLGRAAWRQGAYEDARAYLDEAERHLREVDNLAQAARGHYLRASLELDEGNLAAARTALNQAIAALNGQPRADEYLWWIIERAGSLACQQGHLERGAQLCAAGLAQRDALPTPVDPAERDLRQRDQEALRAGLDAAALAAATSEGQALTLDAALALAREELAAS